MLTRQFNNSFEHGMDKVLNPVFTQVLNSGDRGAIDGSPAGLLEKSIIRRAEDV